MDKMGARVVIWHVKTNIFIYLLGRLFFPRQAPWQQRKNVLNLLGALAAGLFVGGLLVVYVLYQNRKH